MPRSRPSAAQSTSEFGCPGGRCPETTTNSWVRPRWVTGMPASAGTATALVTPGTTSTGTPAATHASSSSIPRPKTNGSPPLSRTTRRPASACSTSSELICSCAIERPRGNFDASMTSTSPGREDSSDWGARWSATTTSAWEIACRPRTVISPGSPGPATHQDDGAAPPAGGRARRPVGDAAVGQAGHDRVPHPDRPLGIAAPVHPDHMSRAARSRGSRRSSPTGRRPGRRRCGSRRPPGRPPRSPPDRPWPPRRTRRRPGRRTRSGAAPRSASQG